MIVIYGNIKLVNESYIRNYRGSSGYYKRGEVLKRYICEFWAGEGFSGKGEGLTGAQKPSTNRL